MLKYLKKLYQNWKDNAVKVVIIKIGILLYPIIKSHGGGLNAPLAITVEDRKSAENLYYEIKGFEARRMVPLGLSKREFIRYLVSAEYELFFAICDYADKRSFQNLLTLKNAMVSGEVEGHIFSVLPVIVFVGGIPNEFAELLSGKIVIEGKNVVNEYANSEETTREIVNMFLENMSMIESSFTNLRNNDSIYFLKYAKETTRILLGQMEHADSVDISNLLPDIEEGYRKMETEWDIYSDYTAWIELLRKEILGNDWKSYGMADRDDVHDEEFHRLSNYVLYDKNYYYITTEFFGLICDKVPCIGQAELKRALYDEGILIGEGANRTYMTVKVPIKTCYGIDNAGRRLRISRKWLDLPGELTWQERICESIKQKENPQGTCSIKVVIKDPAESSGSKKTVGVRRSITVKNTDMEREKMLRHIRKKLERGIQNSETK